MNRELLVKLMRMTTSPHDAEALVALRKANAMLAEAKVDWHDVLSGKATSAGGSRNSKGSSDYRTPPSQRNVDVPTILDLLLRTVNRRSSFYEYVRSVNEYYELHGCVSTAQEDVIRKAYYRATTGNRRAT